MKPDIRHYARVGVIHHMLYPHSMGDFDEHAATLERFVQRGDIETFDCCLPYGKRRQARLVSVIRNCGKSDIAFAMHLFPLRKLSPCTTAPNEQVQVRMIVQDMIEQAAAIGASGFIFGSGGPAPAEAGPAHHAAFADFCRWLCGQLAPHGMTGMIEPFDTEIDKRFLYGSSADCVALIESLKPEVANLGIELDFAHVPLMGERFDQAIKATAPHLKRVHVGNCVLKDRRNPRYGDTHPPIGFAGGEVGVAEVTNILRTLLEVGYLSTQSRGSVLLEMTPWPGRTEEETIQDSIRKLEQAWSAV